MYPTGRGPPPVTVSRPDRTCRPFATASIRAGDALSTSLLTERAVHVARPAPPPVPPWPDLAFVTPSDHEVTSISLAWRASRDSPSMPSSLRNTAIARLP